MASVIMKWGGGLITDKSSLCLAHQHVINDLSSMASLLVESGHKIIIVHGAGSFGHIRAIEYDLANGRDYTKSTDWQDSGIDLVRTDMDTLHSHVVTSLHNHGLNVCSHRPRDFVVGTGSEFVGNIESFNTFDDTIHVTFGDVVRCPSPHEFGILSGDDLMFRLATEIPGITHAIFALGGTAGMMTSAPGDDKSKLIPEWSRSDGIIGTHDGDIDVTGGIYLKADRASAIAQSIDHVWFIDGQTPDRILELIDTGNTIGTRIIS